MKKYGNIICSECGETTLKTTPGKQKYCPKCRDKVASIRKKKHYIKNNPNAYKPNKFKKCSVCDEAFSSSFEGIPYCNKHYLKMYAYGTLDPVRKKSNKFTIKGDIVILYTSKNEPFIIDKDDFEMVHKSTWCLNSSGKYLVATINKKIKRLHRLIMDVEDPSVVVDHINGNPRDNRKQNLRITTQKMNSRNTRSSKNNPVGYPGIDKLKSGKYRARITYNRKAIHLGIFNSIEEAKQVRIAAENKYFKEFSPSKGVLK